MRTFGPSISVLDTRAAKPSPKEVDPHYLTPEHQAWRQEVLRRAGFKCEDCGRSGCRLFADHIKERKDGGELFDPENGRCRCGSCHTIKTNAERAKRMGAALPG
jgi:hypothetical protein